MRECSLFLIVLCCGKIALSPDTHILYLRNIRVDTLNFIIIFVSNILRICSDIHIDISHQSFDLQYIPLHSLLEIHRDRQNSDINNFQDIYFAAT